MGATGISTTVKTADIRKVWEEMRATSNARWNGMYHEDAAYSGDWNTVSFGKVKKVLDKYSETKAKAWLKKNGDTLWDSIAKRDSITFDFGVVNYEVWTVKKSCPKNKKTPKYETKFVVYHKGGNYGETEVVDATTKTATEANTKASSLALKSDTVYHVKKTRVLISGTEETATFEIVKKIYKSKPKSVKKGSVLKEVHLYKILGIAAC